MKVHRYQGKNSAGLTMDAEIREAAPARFYVNVIPSVQIFRPPEYFKSRERAEKFMHKLAKMTDETVTLEFIETTYE